MLRLALIAAISLCAGCASPTVESHYTAAGTDAAEIYGKFLDDWTGKEKDPVNVSISAKKPTAEELEELSDCADKSTKWLPTGSIDDLTNLVGNLSYVHLVDPNKWSALDPGKLIAQGKPVDSAVKSGFDHGLMTFSAVVFDSPHKTAAFMYSFSCGMLCGHGGIVTFRKEQDRWVKSKNECGQWMSHVQGGRPNNSFKPTPLRGAA